MKNLLCVIFLFILTSTTWAHKDVWEIRATALPEEDRITFTLFFSLEQLNEEFQGQFYCPLYKEDMQGYLKENLIALVPKLITVKEGDKKITPFVKAVNISAQSLKDEEQTAFSPLQTDIDFELVFPLSPNAEKLDITWHIFADKIIDKWVNDKSELPKGALDVYIYFADEKFTRFTVNSKSPNFSWNRDYKAENISLATQEEMTAVKHISFSKIYLAIGLFIFALLLWAFSVKRLLSTISYAALVLALIPLSMAFTKQEAKKSKLPSQKAVNHFLKESLMRIYHATNTVENENKWQSLSGICSEPFKTKVFIDGFKSENSSFTHFVDSLEIDSLEITSNNKVTCQWTIVAAFQHLSHVHKKNLSFKGDFTFAEKDNMWLIDGVSINRIIK